MNIFYTNPNPVECAREHCKVHVIKMILEYAQLLSTAHHLTGSGTSDMYKPTHANHPSAIWTRESSEHYEWLYECWLELLDIYKTFSGKPHASTRLVSILAVVPNLPPYPFVPPCPAVPEALAKANMSALEKYQTYMQFKFSDWRTRVKPIQVVFPITKPQWMN